MKRYPAEDVAAVFTDGCADGGGGVPCVVVAVLEHGEDGGPEVFVAGVVQESGGGVAVEDGGEHCGHGAEMGLVG